MAKPYRVRKLTLDERRMAEQVLLEQIEVQRWYAVRFLASMGSEIVLTLQ